MACKKHENCCRQHACTLNEPEKHDATPLENGNFHVDTYPSCHTRSGRHGTVCDKLPDHAQLVAPKKRAQAA